MRIALLSHKTEEEKLPTKLWYIFKMAFRKLSEETIHFFFFGRNGNSNRKMAVRKVPETTIKTLCVRQNENSDRNSQTNPSILEFPTKLENNTRNMNYSTQQRKLKVSLNKQQNSLSQAPTFFCTKCSSVVVVSWSRGVLVCMGECQDSVVLLVDAYWKMVAA